MHHQIITYEKGVVGLCASSGTIFVLLFDSYVGQELWRMQQLRQPLPCGYEIPTTKWSLKKTHLYFSRNALFVVAPKDVGMKHVGACVVSADRNRNET